MAKGTTGGQRARQRERTQQRILAAARQLFAEHGYQRTTIRAVAAAARTDPGLVMRYFGSKDELFGRVARMSPEESITGGPDEVAEAVLASLAAKLTGEPTATLASLRSMLTHPEATRDVHDAAVRQEHQLAEAIPGDDAAVRAGLVGAITMGTIVARHLLRLDGLRDATPEQITALLRPHVRALLGAD